MTVMGGKRTFAAALISAKIEHVQQMSSIARRLGIGRTRLIGSSSATAARIGLCRVGGRFTLRWKACARRGLHRKSKFSRLRARQQTHLQRSGTTRFAVKRVSESTRWQSAFAASDGPKRAILIGVIRRETARYDGVIPGLDVERIESISAREADWWDF